MAAKKKKARSFTVEIVRALKQSTSITVMAKDIEQAKEFAFDQLEELEAKDEAEWESIDEEEYVGFIDENEGK